ncbi:hypothetical protein Fcan01_13029, partial [Folsomia candida]
TRFTSQLSYLIMVGKNCDGTEKQFKDECTSSTVTKSTATENENTIKARIEGGSSIIQISKNADTERGGGVEEQLSDSVGGEELHFFSRYRGMLLALLSSFMFSLTSMLVKFLESYDPVTIALWRFQGALLPSVVFLVFKLTKERYSNALESNSENRKEFVSKQSPRASLLDSLYPPTDKKRLKMLMLVLVRSILTCNALLLHFYSLKNLDMGDALVISSSTPVFVTLFAHYFLGEKCGVIPILSAVMTVFGVIVIAKPPHIFDNEEFDRKTMIGTFLALGSMLVATCSYLVLRYIRKVHHVLTTLFFGGWGTAETVVLVLVLGVWSWPNCYKDWLAAIALASLTFTGQMAIILAMKCEKAGPVSLVRTCDVIFAFFWQICVFDCWPEIYRYEKV